MTAFWVPDLHVHALLLQILVLQMDVLGTVLP
jgi:hypothetical protein